MSWHIESSTGGYSSPWEQQVRQQEWRMRESPSIVTGDGLRAADYDAAMIKTSPKHLDVPLHLRPTAPTPNADMGLLAAGRIYPSLGSQSFTFVGAGPGSIMLGSHLVERGADPEKMTFLEQDMYAGGLWAQDWVRDGGFNNPAALTVAHSKLDLDSRNGIRMLNFVQGVKSEYLADARFVRDTHATDLHRGTRDSKWQVRTKDGGALESDIVVLATGQPIPRRIASDRIASNLDSFRGPRRRMFRRAEQDDSTVNTHQRNLTAEEIASGRPVVIVGLGNSTGTMMRHIQDISEAGESIDYTILTDRTARDVEYPDYNPGGKPIFRNPQEGYLTGFSGDLRRDRDAYILARHERAITSDVRSAFYDGSSRRLRVTSHPSERRTAEDVYQDPIIFSLVGSERDNRLFVSADAEPSDLAYGNGWQPEIRASDGAVATRRDGYMSNLYTIGAAAATPANPNAAVIPGIFGQLPATALTIGIRSETPGFVRRLR